MQLGNRIKQRRRELELSQRELAEQVGLTAGFLSQVERGQIAPSIKSLRKISGVLGVPLSDSDFLVAADVKRPVVRHGERLRLTLPNSNITYELLTRDLKQPMDVFEVELRPEDGDVATLFPRQTTEECIFVLDGQLEIDLGERTYLLGRGDSIYFEGILLRHLVAIGDEPLRFITAITPSVL